MKGTLSKLSSFAIHKGVKGIAGGDVTIKRQFSGDIYLTCSKNSQSDFLAMLSCCCDSLSGIGNLREPILKLRRMFLVSLTCNISQ